MVKCTSVYIKFITTTATGVPTSPAEKEVLLLSLPSGHMTTFQTFDWLPIGYSILLVTWLVLTTLIGLFQYHTAISILLKHIFRYANWGFSPSHCNYVADGKNGKKYRKSQGNLSVRKKWERCTLLFKEFKVAQPITFQFREGFF